MANSEESKWSFWSFMVAPSIGIYCNLLSPYQHNIDEPLFIGLVIEEMATACAVNT